MKFYTKNHCKKIAEIDTFKPLKIVRTHFSHMLLLRHRKIFVVKADFRHMWLSLLTEVSDNQGEI